MSNEVDKRLGLAEWQGHYRSRWIAPEDAARLVKPGMRVHFPLAGGSVVQRALAARAGELSGSIDVRLTSPLVDPGWFANDLSDVFKIEFELFIGNLGRPAHDAHRGTYLPNLFTAGFKAHDERPGDTRATICTASHPAQRKMRLNLT